MPDQDGRISLDDFFAYHAFYRLSLDTRDVASNEANTVYACSLIRYRGSNDIFQVMTFSFIRATGSGDPSLDDVLRYFSEQMRTFNHDPYTWAQENMPGVDARRAYSVHALLQAQLWELCGLLGEEAVEDLGRIEWPESE